MRRQEIRIAVVYRRTPVGELRAMDTIRWVRVAEGLADLGFSVDLIADRLDGSVRPHPTLRIVPWAAADWSRYHVVKTLFHKGFRAFLDAGGAGHPFVISKLGSVVGSHDGTPGVHFSGEERRNLWDVQVAIRQHARYVTLLTEPSRTLWEAELGHSVPILMVPTGVDRHVPRPSASPYPASGEKVVVYIGNIYEETQREINLLWQERLSALGRRLRLRGLRLYFVGPGRTDQLDTDAVVPVGPVPHAAIWDYQYFADVGLALAQGALQHNESSKIYYYLRTGLPVVSETPIPNNHVIEEAGCGLVAPYGDDVALAEMIEAAAFTNWERERAIQYVLRRHAWDHRMRVYERLLVAAFAEGSRPDGPRLPSTLRSPAPSSRE